MGGFEYGSSVNSGDSAFVIHILRLAEEEREKGSENDSGDVGGETGGKEGRVGEISGGEEARH